MHVRPYLMLMMAMHRQKWILKVQLWNTAVILFILIIMHLHQDQSGKLSRMQMKGKKKSIVYLGNFL